MCVTPALHRHHDVFHVTTRRLKCSRLEWDPRFVTTTPATPSQDTPRSSNSLTEDHEDSDLPVVVEEEEDPNWIPLTAYKAPPIEVDDLLEIAEAEMPEDTYAPLEYPQEKVEETVRPEQSQGEESDERREEEEEEDDDEEEGQQVIMEEDVTNEIPVLPRVDQAALMSIRRHRGRGPVRLRDGGIPAAAGVTSRAEYRILKINMRADMEEQRRRRVEEMMAGKQVYRRRLMEQKRREKARRAEQRRRMMEQKESHMDQFLREQEHYRMRVAAQEAI
ncbi:hypothetical protein Pmani_029655 [Petrolisthes manimaculis]|uniref:Uncharacterized protein n=1 Tax=Petrolisthes manimaculis TaxID=1843537 RepID=A0AAE1TWR4_9EUCA|nr:hypothetical protein Pmani_029655 [Petrolisthes manimaculis]